MATMDPRAWGIAEGYHDVGGGWHATSEQTVDAFLAAMGAETEHPPAGHEVRVVRAGDHVPVDRPSRLDLEDGGDVRVEGQLPPDVPLGYHRLTPLDGHEGVRLIVGPGRCHLPAGLRTWGWAAQLPTVRSATSWGMGDLADLRELGRWSSSELGAGMLLVNPLHAPRTTLPQQPSPYFPSSRRYRSPLYLRIDEVPGFDPADTDLAALAEHGRALNAASIVDRDAIWAVKLAALERLWSRFGGDPAFDAYVAGEGEGLTGFATFNVLDELRAEGEPLPHPASVEVAVVRRERADRIRFHAWVQWLLDRQLSAAGATVDLMQDLAVGFDPGGADAWQYQDVVATGACVGAPPDEFNQAGQDWGLPPFDPWRLRAAGYEPFIETLRNGFRHAGGLRVDHVMGLFRLFWIPAGAGPSEGAYVHYPWGDLLEILALESHRAGAYVVGEDLGTVEDHVRRELAARDVLSYRLLWFEDRPPAEYPEHALAAVTTHDLPTIAGLWHGTDVDDQRRAGVEPNEASTKELRDRVQRLVGLPDDADVDDVVARVYELLGQAPSAILVATLEDLLAAEPRPNLPGTTEEARPNWSIALPATLEDIEAHPRAQHLAAALRRQ